MSMPATTRQRGAQASGRRIPARWIAVAVAVVLLAAIGFSTRYRSPETAAAAAPKKFDPVAYGAATYESKVVPAIEKDAVALPVLMKALVADKDAAGEKYGHHQGIGLYSFPVKATGTAGEVRSGLMSVTVPGLPQGTRVSVQVGPAINGTALRDAAGFITFGQFLNQVEYADAATALNNEMRQKLLSTLDAGSLDGKKITFVGAFSPLTPTTVTVTPVSIEEGP
jgi:predicted lipoprotein